MNAKKWFWLNSGANYIPTDFSGLQWWYDAEQMTGYADNDPTTTILDFSGNNYTIANAVPAAPAYKTGIINSLPALLYNGTSTISGTGLRNGDFFHEGDFTAIWVLRPVSVTSNRVIMDSNAQSTTSKGIRLRIQNNGIVNMAVGNGTSNVISLTTATGSLPSGQTSILVIRCEGDTYTIEINNLIVATGSLGNARVAGASLFAVAFFRQSNSAAAWYDGYCAEWMAYNRALTYTELDQLIGGLPYGL